MDFVNLQIWHAVVSVEYYIEAVLQYLGRESFKLIAGFTNPQPDVALEVVNLLRGPLRGAFTWSIERSQQNTPPYCLEKGQTSFVSDLSIITLGSSDDNSPQQLIFQY